MTVKRDIFPCDDGERQFSYDGEDSDCFHVMVMRDSFPLASELTIEYAGVFKKARVVRTTFYPKEAYLF